MTDQHESKIPREPRELRNTHEARDDEPQPIRQMPDYDAAGFWPPAPRADLTHEAIVLLRRVRDRTQYVPHNQFLQHIVGQLEGHEMLLRTEHHY